MSQTQGTEEVTERPTWLVPVILSGITFLIAGIILYWYFGPTVDDLLGKTPDASFSERPVTMSINGHVFRIPENYTQFPKHRKGGELPSVALYGLYPRIDPFYARSADAFANNGPKSRVVHFTIETYRSPLTEEERLTRLYLDLVTDPNGTPFTAGLTRFTFKPNTGRFNNEDLFVADLDGGKVAVILCVRESDAVPNPSCRRDLYLGGGLGLTYRFKRARLNDWQRIDERVVALVRGFGDIPDGSLEDALPKAGGR